MKTVYTWKVFWKDIRQVDWNYDGVSVTEIQPDDVRSKCKEFPELIEMPDDPNPYSQSFILHWDVYEISEENIKQIGQHAEYHFGCADADAVFSIGEVRPTRYGPEWCFTLYASSDEAFLSGLSKNLELARKRECNNIFCIHQPEFTHLYDSLEWLKERNHDISLVLHERYLHQE
jgi:hypothetical protein